MTKKEWKLGQCVTINRKKYRIVGTHSRDRRKSCSFCKRKSDEPCLESRNDSFNVIVCAQKIKDGHYPELIKQKIQHVEYL